jgi:hypothetical protein
MKCLLRFCLVAATAIVAQMAMLQPASAALAEPPPIKAFCIDFNWGPQGIYGFAKPGDNSLPLPIAQYRSNAVGTFTGNDKNIAVLLRYFNRLPFDYPAATP